MTAPVAAAIPASAPLPVQPAVLAVVATTTAVASADSALTETPKLKPKAMFRCVECEVDLANILAWKTHMENCPSLNLANALEPAPAPLSAPPRARSYSDCTHCSFCNTMLPNRMLIQLHVDQCAALKACKAKPQQEMQRCMFCKLRCAGFKMLEKHLQSCSTRIDIGRLHFGAPSSVRT